MGTSEDTAIIVAAALVIAVIALLILVRPYAASEFPHYLEPPHGEPR